MSDAPEYQDPQLKLRQWLNENLKDVQQGVIRFPPRAVIDALASLGMSFNVGWSTVVHNGRTDVTTWTCTLASDCHLVDVKAEARRWDDRMWLGEVTDDTTQYVQVPTVTVDVVRLDSVSGLTLNEGSSDDAQAPWPPKQTWAFTFGDAEPREFVLGGREVPPSGDAVAALCQLLAGNV